MARKKTPPPRKRVPSPARKATPSKPAREPGRKPGATAAPSPPPRGKPFPIVGIGASAGGFEAFRELLKTLPADTGMAYVLVQHLDPKHESILTRLLSGITAMQVTEVREGVAVEPNCLYVIPPNATMRIRQGALHLTARGKSSVLHLPIDDFLRSLAEDQGNLAIGVILSGAASDGTIGLKAIKAEGGITFAQDSQSAKYDCMPRSAVAAGCVDFVLPPAAIARELARIGQHPYLGIAPRTKAADGDDDLRKIFVVLERVTGVDFSYYKHNTIQRRIARRMLVHKLESQAQYLKLLRENPDEPAALCEDILIHVTNFFREPESFQALAEYVLPRILEHKPPEEPLRIWVPGCSTGEEAYSIGIVLAEFLEGRASGRPIQLFGTDISEPAIEKARVGVYPETALGEMSTERLRRFFFKVEGGYQIVKSMREMCVFARQDLTRDPPFSRLDLISCRNVLIYMGPVLQGKVIGTFHYALKSTGYLMLGKSESVTGFADLFTLVDRKHRICVKNPATPSPWHDLSAAAEYGKAVPAPTRTWNPSRGSMRGWRRTASSSANTPRPAW